MELSRVNFSFLLAALCLLILVLAQSGDGKKFETGDQTAFVDSQGRCIKDGNFYDDCNTCFCKKGSVPGCTYKQCIHKREAPAGKISPGGRCKPGDKWKLDECNNCVCTHTGYASCSLNECSPKKKGKRSVQQGKVNPGGRCKPGDKWKLDECNNCVCTHTGYASCSLNDCKDNKRGKRAPSIGKPLGFVKMEGALQPDEI